MHFVFPWPRTKLGFELVISESRWFLAAARAGLLRASTDWISLCDGPVCTGFEYSMTALFAPVRFSTLSSHTITIYFVTGHTEALFNCTFELLTVRIVVLNYTGRVVQSYLLLMK